MFVLSSRFHQSILALKRKVSLLRVAFSQGDVFFFLVAYPLLMDC